MRLSLFSRNELADSCDFGGRFDPEVYQGVGEFGHDLGQLPGVVFGKAIFALMGKLVAGVSAGIANLFNVVRDTSFLSEKPNLFPKHGLRFVIGNSAGLGNVVGQLLQTDPKQYTCASRRKGDDALCLEEFFQGFFRHVLSSFYAARNRIDHFFALPKNQSIAGLTLAYNGLLMRKHLSDIGNAYGRIRPHYVEAAHRIAMSNRRLNFGNN